MIVEEVPLSLRRRLSVLNHVFGHGGLGKRDSELRELAVYAGSSPERIGSAHVPDQFANAGRDGRSPRQTPSALPCPIAFESTAVPTDNGLGLTTVSGFTTTSTLSQSVQTLRKNTQKPRSMLVSRGRFT